jgi:hypothetical protein
MSTCLNCGLGYGVTWEQQRRQFGRLIRRGFTAEQAKKILPRCQKCVTTYLRMEGPPCIESIECTGLGT